MGCNSRKTNNKQTNNERSLRIGKKKRCKAGKSIMLQHLSSSLEFQKARAPWNGSESGGSEHKKL
jgi:hypothetical protein